MHKSTLIGLGAALATFAAGVTEASASCRRTCPHYAPPAAYGYAPPPAAVYGYPPPPAYYGPPAPVYGYYPPPAARVYEGYGYRPPVYDDAYRPAGVWIEIR